MSWKTDISKSYPIRLKNNQRFKAEVVARNKGRKLAEHIHWLIQASINNYEAEYGEIQIKKEE